MCFKATLVLCPTPYSLIFNYFVGWGGYEGDGDITNPENIEAFKDYVMMYTEGKGVHFVMADGVSIIHIVVLQ